MGFDAIELNRIVSVGSEKSDHTSCGVVAQLVLIHDRVNSAASRSMEPARF